MISELTTPIENEQKRNVEFGAPNWKRTSGEQFLTYGTRGEGRSWGREYVTFHLSGDLDVRIGIQEYNHAVDMTFLFGLSTDNTTGMACTRDSYTVDLPKARARAIASALMGAASEL